MFSVITVVKQVAFLICLCLTLTLFPSESYALRVQDVPNPRIQYGGWVTDMAQILNSETEAQLNQIISNLEQENEDEIAIVTIPETSPSPTPKAFTTELFNKWGIGKREKNNGVLFLISVRDRRVEIETGYGIKDILSNAYISKVIQQEIIPQFKQGNFQNGILTGTKSLVSRLSQNQDALHNEDKSYTKFSSFLKKPEMIVFFWFCIFWTVFIGVYWMWENLISKPDSKRKYSGGSDTTITGDNSFGSGGGDFGGGSSGGDGGGGSW